MLLLAAPATFGALPTPAAADSGEASAAQRRSCGTISSTSIYPRARIVAIRHVGCRKARRIAKRYDARGRQSPNWSCGLARDRPRLFSCGSGGRRGDLRRFPRALESIGVRNAAGAEAQAARCSSVSYGRRTYVLFHRRISCTSARRKVRHVHSHKRLRGWRCSSGSGFRTGGFCQRGRKTFGWHPGD